MKLNKQTCFRRRVSSLVLGSLTKPCACVTRDHQAASGAVWQTRDRSHSETHDARELLDDLQVQRAARPDRVLRVYHLRHDDSAETDMFQASTG